MNRPQRIALFAVFFLLLELALYFLVDRPLSDVMRSIEAVHPAFTDFFRAVTDLAQGRCYLIPTGLGVGACALLMRTKYASEKIAQLGQNLLLVFITVAASGLITNIVKPIIGRARPVLRQRDDIYGFHPFSADATWRSLPSGHATSAMTMLVLLWVLLPRWRAVWLVVFIGLTFSRVIVNAHYLSDIMAGAAVGGLTAWYFIKNRHLVIFPRTKVFFPLTSIPPTAKN